MGNYRRRQPATELSPSTIELKITGDRKQKHKEDTTTMSKYDDYDWAELPEEVKAAATTLGCTKKMWDKDKEPEACDEDWDDLTPEQQQAAGVRLHERRLGQGGLISDLV